MQIANPVLPGFNADPSMIRVGDTYYIANSTFEWFPGVRLHESKDMVHWNLLPSPLSRTSQLDMRGNPSSGGIWAPDLSYADGKFWLIYTDVKVVNGAFKDCTNYLVTAESIHGPWSEPIRVNGVGIRGEFIGHIAWCFCALDGAQCVGLANQANSGARRTETNGHFRAEELEIKILREGLFTVGGAFVLGVIAHFLAHQAGADPDWNSCGGLCLI